ncbi:rhodanese-like domain-containing protein [Geoalkalibacter sp.]|uniref:rhodanese-like domain-containing protein n=1 Tax=Geoalkalibacter sp. TaxID=3041440 RepID=UPI00272EDA5C|nr:rhodanese-like domain-containing protein [Geoalkalibacter sp.]
MIHEDTKRIFLEALVIVALGVVVGLSVNYRLVFNAFSGKSTAPVVRATSEQAGSAYPLPLSLDEVRQAQAEGALLIDARVGEMYREGHIPGALSLPWADVDEFLDDFRARVAPERRLILYCSGYGCPDSFDLGIRLIDEGYLDVWTYEGGMPEWRAAGLPVEKGEPAP